MNELNADLINSAWRKVDIKLSVDGDMHIIRWRRGWFVDEVLFDDRRIATSTGLFSRDTLFGLELETQNAARVKLILSIDTSDDMSGDMRPRGVRLESAEKALIATGSLGPEQPEPFLALFDRAIKAIGLS